MENLLHNETVSDSESTKTNRQSLAQVNSCVHLQISNFACKGRTRDTFIKISNTTFNHKIVEKSNSFLEDLPQAPEECIENSRNNNALHLYRNCSNLRSE